VQETGERARERVREHYSWGSVTDAYEQLFHDVLSEAR
jgi:glycosyltransferase involved in cell wall biosynthesis